MDPEIKKLIEALGRAVEELKAENDKRLKAIEAKGYAPADLEEKVEKINAEITHISGMKKQLEQLETVVGRGGAGGATAELDRIKGEHKGAFDKWFRKGGDTAAIKDLEIKAGLSTQSDPDGGYIVAPPEFDTAIDRVAANVSAMRSIANVRQIGANTYKKFMNIGGTGSGWVGEEETRVETDTPLLKEIIINVQQVYAEPHTTQDMLDDGIVDIASWLADEVIVEFTDQEGDKFINGNGTKQPHGIGNYTMAANSAYAWGKIGYIASGHASLLNNADKLVSLQHALKPKYRANGTFLMNDATCEAIRVLKDGDGNYIWRAGLIAGAPDMLLGKPIAYDDNVANIGASAYPLYFGDFKRAYLIVDRIGVRIIRDALTTKGKVKFYTTKRVGGGIVNFEALKALKISA